MLRYIACKLATFMGALDRDSAGYFAKQCCSGPEAQAQPGKIVDWPLRRSMMR